VEIDEDTSFSVGDFLGANAVALFQVEAGVIYLSITDIAGSSKALNSGTVGAVVVQGLSVGQCVFTIAIDDLRFIDAAGADVELADLEATEVSLSVQ